MENQLADRLLALGDAEGAMVEYERFLQTTPEAPGEYLARLNLAEALVMLGDTHAAERSLRIAERMAGTPEDRELAQLRRGMVSLAAGSGGEASLAFLTLRSSSRDSEMFARSSYLGGLGAIQQSQWAQARSLFSEAFASGRMPVRPEAAKQLDSLLGSASNLSHRSPGAARWMSTFLPGSGQMYAGHFWSGIHASLLNGLGVALAIQSGRDHEWGEVFINVTMFVGRYYMGNRYHAALQAERHNAAVRRRMQQKATELARAAVSERATEEKGPPGGRDSPPE